MQRDIDLIRRKLLDLEGLPFAFVRAALLEMARREAAEQLPLY